MLKPESTTKKIPNLPPITAYSAKISSFESIGNAITTEPLASWRGTAIILHPVPMRLELSTSMSNGAPWVAMTVSSVRFEKFGIARPPPVDEISPRN